MAAGQTNRKKWKCEEQKKFRCYGKKQARILWRQFRSVSTFPVVPAERILTESQSITGPVKEAAVPGHKDENFTIVLHKDLDFIMKDSKAMGIQAIRPVPVNRLGVTRLVVQDQGFTHQL